MDATSRRREEISILNKSAKLLREIWSLVDALHDHLKKWEQPHPPEGWFKQHLSKGCCLIMLDGLNEVADPEVRMAVVTWVERQMVAYRD